MKSKLKSCPFCGSYAYYIHYTDRDHYAISCVDCSVTTNVCPTQKQAALLWNKRAKIGKTEHRDKHAKKDNSSHFVDDFLR